MQEFFTTVGRRQYVGARYVPVFGRKGESSIAWDNSAPYEPLTIVTYEGNSYTSKTYVPADIDISNTDYWALTGNYWAQIEEYRREVELYNGRISSLEGAVPISDFDAENTVKGYIDNEVLSVESLLPASEFDSDNTVKNYVDSKTSNVSNDVASLAAVIPSTDFTSESTVKDYVDGLGEIIPSTEFDAENTVKEYVDSNIGTVDGKVADVKKDSYAFESASITPMWLGAFAEQTPNTEGHGGGIASNGTYQVHIASKSDTTDMGTVSFINIDTNNSRYMTPKSVLLGHANSICYYPENNVFIVAPEFTYAGGSEVQWKELLIYNPDFSVMSRVSTPASNSSIQSVSYDHVTNKLYALGIDNKLYEVSQTYEFTEIGEIMRQNVYNQDFAVYDGIFYNSSPSGFLKYGRIDTCEVLGYFNLERTSNTRMHCFGELNGMEFDEYGHLLACGDYSPAPGITDWGLVYSVFQIPLRFSPIFYPTVEPEGAIGYITGVTIDATVFKLRGYTLQHPNLISSFQFALGDYLQIHIASNVSVARFWCSSCSDVELRFDSNKTITADMIVFVATLHIFGTGTIVTDNLACSNRAPLVVIETGCTFESKSSSNANITPSFSYGSSVMNGGTSQDSAKFMGINLGTYRLYVNSRTPTYLIS